MNLPSDLHALRTDDSRLAGMAQTLGSGSDVWKYWDEKRAGNLSDQSWCEIEDGIARSPGHCMTMGTRQRRMTSMAEVLGMCIARRGVHSQPWIRLTHAWPRRRRVGRSSRTSGTT